MERKQNENGISVWILVLGASVALGGCHDARTCAGPPADELYTVLERLDGPETVCPMEVGHRSRDGSLVPWYCEELEESAGQCGTTATYRCDVDSLGDTTTMTVEIEISWDEGDGVGGADVVQRDESGAVVCAAEYSAEVTAW